MALGVIFATGCIKDDLVFDAVDPVIRLTSRVDTIEAGMSFQMEFDYLNNVGKPESVVPQWTSSDKAILDIDNSGLAMAIKAGQATVGVEYDNGQSVVRDETTVHVGASTVVTVPTARNGTIRTTSSYELTGTFTLSEGATGLVLSIADDYKASSALPGLYLYLTNNPNSVDGAHEIGAVTIFSGEHQYTVSGVELSDFSHLLYYCKPFNVKVGDGKIEDAE